MYGIPLGNLVEAELVRGEITIPEYYKYLTIFSEHLKTELPQRIYMKTNLLNPASICALVISISFINGCSKNQPDSKTVNDTVITSVFPLSAKGGETITVYGKNLLKDTTEFSLTVNAKRATVTKFTNDSVKATVPEKAGTGKVVIKTASRTYEGPEITYTYTVTVTTVAGTGTVGRGDGDGSVASFNCP